MTTGTVDGFATAVAASKFRRLSNPATRESQWRSSIIPKTSKNRKSAGDATEIARNSKVVILENDNKVGFKRFRAAVQATMLLSNRRTSDPAVQQRHSITDVVGRRGTIQAVNMFLGKRRSGGDFIVKDLRLVNAINRAAELRKKRLLRKFRVVARSIGYMIHLSQRVRMENEDTNIAFRAEMKRLDEALSMNDSGQVPLINRIDTSYYKANTQMRMSQEGKRILSKQPRDRTEKEIQYATIALRNVKTIADYPLHIQQQLAKYGFFESYEPKRIVVKEGRPSENYYILIYGQVLFAKMDAGNMAKRLGSLYRGYYFGELGIYNGTPRQSSIITEEYTELLRVSDVVSLFSGRDGYAHVSIHKCTPAVVFFFGVDFKRIFMGGDISRDPERDIFLTNVIYLKGWPLDVLKGKRKAIMTSYYQRKSILTRDSNLSEWIYIVKSGSIRVMKKLVKSKATTSKRNGLHKRLANSDGYQAFLSTEDEYQRFILYNNIETPPPLTRNGDTESITSLSRGESSLTLPLMLKLQRACRPRTAFTDVTDTSSNQSQRSSFTARSTGYERTNSKRVSSVCASSVQSPRTRVSSSMSSHEPQEHKLSVSQRNDEGRRTIFDDWDAATKFKDKELTEADLNPQFVQVQTLTKGQVFGLQYVLYKDQQQPSFIVTSNGAECVKINRKVFEDNLSYHVKMELLKLVPPYPTDVYLQDRLVTQLNWEAYKHIMIDNMFKEQDSEYFGRYSYKTPNIRIK